MSDQCPCCSGLQYSLCCQPFLSGAAHAKTPEKLMRSRYSAWATQNADYLLDTWHPSCDTQGARASMEASFSSTQWLSLNVISHEAGRHEKEGFVTFFAAYLENQRRGAIHERSRFLREGERWYYIDGTLPQTGRNDACPCGSGKKYKKCCAS